MEREKESIIFYDVDGTLAEPFQAPPLNLRKVIQSLDKAGVKQVLCSGKNKEYLAGMARGLGIEGCSHVIAENGGIIFDWRRQKLHKTSEIKLEMKQIQVELSELLGDLKYYQEPKETIITIFVEEIDQTGVIAENIEKMLVGRNISVKHYKDGAIDIFSGDIHKGIAVEHYIKKFASDFKVYTCGDGVNDLEMLSIGTPITFAGAHAEVLDKVRERGGRVGDKVGPDGLLQAISRLAYENHLADTLNRMSFMYRDWGSWEVLSTGERFKVKKMIVNKNSRLSLQKHLHRSEHWFIFEGEARISLNNKNLDLSAGEDFYIPERGLHRIENIGNSELVVIEVQRGDYLGEDDIVRYD